MDNTLIVFASDHGSVEKVARYLFSHLQGKVDLCNLSKRRSFPDIDPYDTVIIGGSIHSGDIQPIIRLFCHELKHKLMNKRLGLFINCLYDGEKGRQQLDKAFPSELNQVAIVRSNFGGILNPTELTALERLILGSDVRKEQAIDSLSWQKIDTFAQQLSV